MRSMSHISVSMKSLIKNGGLLQQQHCVWQNISGCRRIFGSISKRDGIYTDLCSRKPKRSKQFNLWHHKPFTPLLIHHIFFTDIVSIDRKSTRLNSSHSQI